MKRKVNINGASFFVINGTATRAALAGINISDYDKFYEVTFDGKPEDVPVLYLAKGYYGAPKEVHVFYANGNMYSGFGKTFQEAIDGAVKHGWLQATKGY